MRTNPSDQPRLPSRAPVVQPIEDLDRSPERTVLITLRLKSSCEGWRISVVRRDQRFELSGLVQLLGYLDALAHEPEASPVGGLR